MVLSKLVTQGKLNVRGRDRVEVEEIDQALDVPTASFEKVVRKLADQLRRAKAGVDVAGYRQRMTVAMTGDENRSLPEVRGGGFYQVELRRFPAMDRAEEFRMARRYEFFQLRMSRELVAAGLPEAAAAELVKKSRSVIERALPKGKIDPYLFVALEDLEQLRNLYVEGALHIVLGTVNRYRNLGVDAPDLIQEGNASLFQAIEGFDWRRDVRFRTYAQYWVQQAVLKMLYNSARTVRIPIWVQKLLGKIRRVQEEGRRAGSELSHEQIAEKLDITPEKVAWVLGTKRYALSLDAERGNEEGTSLMNSLADTEAMPIPESLPAGDLGERLDDALSDLPEREQLILRRRFGLGGSEPETLGEIAQDLGITAERVRQLQNAALGRLQKPAKMRRLAAFVE
jgi:RNA polymerase sigma factor (sigma-70 family)